MVTISEKQVSKTSIFELSRVKNCRLCTGPFTRPLLVETVISRLWHVTGSQHFRILVGIYCHNITTHTPQSGYHGVTEVAKTANIPKMAEKCINCMSARPTPPHTNPMESGPGNTFSAQNRKKPKDSCGSTQKKGGCHFFDIVDPPPTPPTSLKTSKKVAFKWGGGGGLGRVRTKNSLGDVFIGQNNDFARG